MRPKTFFNKFETKAPCITWSIIEKTSNYVIWYLCGSPESTVTEPCQRTTAVSRYQHQKTRSHQFDWRFSRKWARRIWWEFFRDYALISLKNSVELIALTLFCYSKLRLSSLWDKIHAQHQSSATETSSGRITLHLVSQNSRLASMWDLLQRGCTLFDRWALSRQVGNLNERRCSTDLIFASALPCGSDGRQPYYTNKLWWDLAWLFWPLSVVMHTNHFQEKVWSAR